MINSHITKLRLSIFLPFNFIYYLVKFSTILSNYAIVLGFRVVAYLD